MNTSDSKGPGSEADEAFEKRARDKLRGSADSLDGEARSRLTRARAAAVDEARAKQGRASWGVWVPAGSLAAAAALAFLLWSVKEQDAPLVANAPASVDGTAESPLDDLEILVASESFELLEDLEFYDSMDIADDVSADIG